MQLTELMNQLVHLHDTMMPLHVLCKIWNRHGKQRPEKGDLKGRVSDYF